MTDDNKIPYVGFGNDILNRKPRLRIGDKIKCPFCREFHKVSGGIDIKTNKETDLLLFYSCGDKSYLAGVAGKNVMTTKPDLSGKI